MSARRRLIATTGWLLALASAGVTLQVSGGGSLAGPPVGDPGRWRHWLEARDPVVAAFALVRMAAVVVLWYLVAVTVAGLLLRITGAVRMMAVADRFTIGPVRRILAGTAGLGLAASAAMAAGGSTVGPATAATTRPATAQTPASLPGTITMHQLPPAEPAPATIPPEPEVASAARSPDRWTVEAGQCFWSIAEAVLGDHLGRAPTDAEIVPYWRRLIEANRSQLAHPGNPDLVFPGQVFALPAP